MPATALDASIGLIELVSASGLVSRLSGVNRRGLPFYSKTQSGRPVGSLIDIPEGDNRENKKSVPMPVHRVTLLPGHIERSKLELFIRDISQSAYHVDIRIIIL